MSIAEEAIPTSSEPMRVSCRLCELKFLGQVRSCTSATTCLTNTTKHDCAFFHPRCESSHAHCGHILRTMTPICFTACQPCWLFTHNGSRVCGCAHICASTALDSLRQGTSVVLECQHHVHNARWLDAEHDIVLSATGGVQMAG